MKQSVGEGSALCTKIFLDDLLDYSFYQLLYRPSNPLGTVYWTRTGNSACHRWTSGTVKAFRLKNEAVAPQEHYAT